MYISLAELVYIALVASLEVNSSEPGSYLQDSASNDKFKWQVAMLEEINSLHVNKTWVLVTKSNDQKLVACRWLDKIKDRLVSLINLGIRRGLWLRVLPNGRDRL